MARKLNKYHVSLPKCRGLQVAAENHEEAVEIVFPDHEYEEKRHGHRWWTYELDTELPEGWPDKKEGDGGGSRIDVELVGTILLK